MAPILVMNLAKIIAKRVSNEAVECGGFPSRNSGLKATLRIGGGGLLPGEHMKLWFLDRYFLALDQGLSCT